jgi:hypothetical protein
MENPFRLAAVVDVVSWSDLRTAADAAPGRAQLTMGRQP